MLMLGSSDQSFKQQGFSRPPFLLTVEQTASELDTNLDDGLTSSKAREFRRQYGPNRLKGQAGIRWYTVLSKQVSNAMVLVLVLAMAISYGITDYIEGGVITAVIVLNITIGFFQEFRAEQKMDALRTLTSPSASVLRDGSFGTTPSPEVVPGDIVQVKVGDTIPADLRLFEGLNLECDEKILTGEAVPVAKDFRHDFSEVTDDLAVGVGDRVNCAYSSSIVTKGRGRGIVIYTGMSTEIGKIAASMQGKSRKAGRSMSRENHGPLQPIKGASLRVWDKIGALLGLTEGTLLQRKLSQLAYILFFCALILAIIVFGVNKFNVTNEVAIYAVSTGIAIIPESLVAVLTLTMVVGTAAMARQKVLVRQLNALEALGGVNHICSDKTGTITQGQMVARKTWVPGVGVYSVTGSDDAANPTRGEVSLDLGPKSEEEPRKDAEKQEQQRDGECTTAGLERDQPAHINAEQVTATDEVDMEKAPGDSPDSINVTPEFEDFLRAIALCNLATVRLDKSKSEWQTSGDPTEIALQVFAHRFDRGKQRLEEAGWRQLNEYPFDSSIKRMSTIYQSHNSNEVLILTKGAVDCVLDLCSTIGSGGQQREATVSVKNEVTKQMEIFAKDGLRVLAVAQRAWGNTDAKAMERQDVEQNLTLVGLAGLYDPPRLESKTAIRDCATAGITVSMLTGDHPETASAIGKEVGLVPRDPEALSKETADSLVKTAAQFDKMSDDEIDGMPSLPLIIARCAPETKTRMIRAIHRRGGCVAMTGDGVNDAPSLKTADIGIAMGLNGSDVAKSASDIVLTDDNFSSIVIAIREGRRMFDNIQKFILHLLAANVGEVILLICGLGFQDASGFSVFPLSPLQILWINMITSSFPAFGLGREAASSELMSRKPHNTKRGAFTAQVIADMMVYGVLIGTITLMTFVTVVYGPGNGSLGVDCNKRYSADCDVVFRARAAVFAALTWLILIAAWEIKSLRRSMFRLDPLQTDRSFPFFHDVYENHFLFWAVLIGALSVFPAVYIPGLNTSVFKHKSIGWEWALAVAAVVIFVTGVEAWKLIKRSTGLFSDGQPDRPQSRAGDLPLDHKM